jgi:hypothetical protein
MTFELMRHFAFEVAELALLGLETLMSQFVFDIICSAIELALGAARKPAKVNLSFPRLGHI